MQVLNLPKRYLSYSALDKFLTRPAEFRRIYYEGTPFISTPEIRFGKMIAEKLEDDDPELSHIKKYNTPEQSFSVTIDGVPIFGYIDSFDTERNRFLEFKTGKQPWTQNRVDKHLQLAIYSLAIKEKFGSVTDECELIWLETEKTNEKTTGLVSHEDSHQIQLTGRVESFTRVIDEAERQATRELIVRTANAISEDYTKWQDEQKNPRRGLLA